MDRRLSAILAADVVGYSRLMGLDEARTLAALKAHRAELIDAKISAHGGRTFKHTGDGMLVEFGSVVNAVACAVEIQRAMRERNREVAEDRRIEFRLGITLGDVVVEGDDIFGDGVNVAARLEGIARPGGIAVSSSVRDQLGGRLEVAFEDLGERALKNIERPVRVFAVSLGSRPAAASTTAPERQGIAVLPFTNMSGDPEQEYFSDGITEDLITDLSKISGLHVVARNTVFTYKGRATNVPQAASELGVRYVLEGSVRKAGNRVRVTSQLIDGRDGGHLWADRFDRELTDIFAIQDEITQAIVGQLKVKLLPEEKSAIGKPATENVEAYTYYLRGRQLSHTWAKSYLLVARRMFAKAAELDPNYARAYAGIADCDSALNAWHRFEVDPASILAMSDKALALDPTLAEAHASRGLALHVAGRQEEARGDFERAFELDQNLYETNFFYGRWCFTRGEFEKAAKLFERAAEIRPDDYRSPALLTAAYRSLGRAADERRAGLTAIERAERELDRHPENPAPAHLGAVALAHLGEHDRAREWVARAIAIAPDDSSTQYNCACAYSLLGETDRALDMLELVALKSTPEQVLWIRHDSDLDAVRNHPRFAQVLETVDSIGRSDPASG